MISSRDVALANTPTYRDVIASDPLTRRIFVRRELVSLQRWLPWGNMGQGAPAIMAFTATVVTSNQQLTHYQHDWRLRNPLAAPNLPLR